MQWGACGHPLRNRSYDHERRGVYMHAARCAVCASAAGTHEAMNARATSTPPQHHTVRVVSVKRGDSEIKLMGDLAAQAAFHEVSGFVEGAPLEIYDSSHERYFLRERYQGHEREANAYNFEITMSELTAVMPPGPALTWLEILQRMNIEAALAIDRRSVEIVVVAGGDAELLAGAVVEYRRRRPLSTSFNMEAMLAGCGYSSFAVRESIERICPPSSRGATWENGSMYLGLPVPDEIGWLIFERSGTSMTAFTEMILREGTAMWAAQAKLDAPLLGD